MDTNIVTEADIWAYLSNSADKETLKKVNYWINSPQYDATFFVEIEQLYNQRKDTPYQLVDTEEAKDLFFKAVQSKPAEKFNWIGLMKYAAMLAVVLSFMTYFFSTKDSGGKVIVKTNFGELRKLEMPDGSSIWLGAASHIRYSTESPRQIYLDGEAFFEVAKNKQIPFVVTTADGIHVEAVGTSFNVRSYRNDPYMETVLLTGKVEVSSENVFHEKYEMLPKDIVTYWRTDKKVNKSALTYVDDLVAWRTGRIQFNNKTFSDIARDMENRFNVKIKFEYELLSTARFTGSFEKGTPIEEILETLKQTREFEYTKLSDNEWIVK